MPSILESSGWTMIPPSIRPDGLDLSSGIVLVDMTSEPMEDVMIGVSAWTGWASGAAKVVLCGSDDAASVAGVVAGENSLCAKCEPARAAKAMSAVPFSWRTDGLVVVSGAPMSVPEEPFDGLSSRMASSAWLDPSTGSVFIGGGPMGKLADVWFSAGGSDETFDGGRMEFMREFASRMEASGMSAGPVPMYDVSEGWGPHTKGALSSLFAAVARKAGVEWRK